MATTTKGETMFIHFTDDDAIDHNARAWCGAISTLTTNEQRVTCPKCRELVKKWNEMDETTPVSQEDHYDRMRYGI